MLYIAQIEVSKRNVWGGVFQTELVLPSIVRNVRSICALAVPRGNFASRSEDAQISETELRNIPDSAQTGVVSISTDNTAVVIDSLPIYVNALLECDGYNKLRTTLSEPINVHSGALLRTIVEESQISPFDRGTDGMFPPYTIKIYLEYDR